MQPGGVLDMGTSGSPIPSGIQAQLILGYGTFANQFPLSIQDGGLIEAYGADKTPFTTVSGAATIGPGTSGAPFNVVDATGWQNGDLIAIDTETVTITGLSGNQIISFAGSLSLAHNSANTVRVAKSDPQRRHPVFRNRYQQQHIHPSEAITGSGSNFQVANTEFEYLGHSASPSGIELGNGSDQISISSSVIMYGDLGLFMNGKQQQPDHKQYFLRQSDGAGNIKGSAPIM